MSTSEVEPVGLRNLMRFCFALALILTFSGISFARNENPPEPKVEERDRNEDGIADIWLYYDENGTHVRSEADRDYDGTPDYFRYLKDGKVDSEKGDIDFDGAIDTWVYYSEGKKNKGERDTNNDGKPDIFIYYEADKIVGVEKDTDFDGQIDKSIGKIPSK